MRLDVGTGMPKDVFPSKIMLFGEYVVLLQAKALVFPFHRFTGSLQFMSARLTTDDSKIRISQQGLRNFHRYITETISKIDLDRLVDLKTFERDLENGLYFSSNIPVGYGVGSSGALTAAVYDRYVKKREDMRSSDQNKIIFIRNHLACLESFFHGNSSGIDPLVSYLNRPVLINNAAIELTDFSLSPEGGLSIALINTKIKRETGTLVKQFMSRCQEPSYLSLVRQLIHFSNNSIEALLQKNDTEFWQHIADLSAFQFQHFTSMIPASCLSLWERGLHTQNFILKLCGSGGGGYLLVFIKDNYSLMNEIRKHNLSILPVSVHKEK